MFGWKEWSGVKSSSHLFSIHFTANSLALSPLFYLKQPKQTFYQPSTFTYLYLYHDVTFTWHLYCTTCKKIWRRETCTRMDGVSSFLASLEGVSLRWVRLHSTSSHNPETTLEQTIPVILMVVNGPNSTNISPLQKIRWSCKIQNIPNLQWAYDSTICIYAWTHHIDSCLMAKGHLSKQGKKKKRLDKDSMIMIQVHIHHMHISCIKGTQILKTVFIWTFSCFIFKSKF